MKTMSSRELKNRTGEAIRTLRRGESLVITVRGKPVGRLTPYRPEEVSTEGVRPLDVAWPEIEEALRRSRPRFATWRDAEDASRGRS